MTSSSAYLLEHAYIDGAVHPDVLVEIENGRFSRVQLGGRSSHLSTEISAPKGSIRRSTGELTTLRGLTLPGLANTHSHAFHRALRGRTQAERGSFWTWREQMYAVAARLDPDSYFALARATYAEMAATGITAVGEFHYLHHQPDGMPYADPNAMGNALIAAAREAGVRIALLDTCYLSGGFGDPPQGAQVRYSDGSADRWAERVGRLDGGDGVVVGAAIHSVRAVPREALPRVVEASAGGPLHVHLSEQVAENDACVSKYGVTPTQVLADAGALGPRTSAVHATHLTDADVALLGESRTYAAFCPTTERDLADGIGPATALARAGSPLTLGSDSHAVIDHFEEMRAIEMHERLVTQQRGHWSAAELIGAATSTGHESLGFGDAGRIAVGARADLVTIDLASPRTAGADARAETAVFAATSADVRHVVADGVVVYSGDPAAIARDLEQAMEGLTEGHRP